MDRLHVKRIRIVGMNYLGIIDTKAFPFSLFSDFFFETEAKVLPHRLNKQKRVAQLIRENRAKTRLHG